MREQVSVSLPLSMDCRSRSHGIGAPTKGTELPDMQTERNRLDLRPHLRQFVPLEKLRDSRCPVRLTPVAGSAGQHHIAEVVPSPQCERNEVIDRGAVRIGGELQKRDPLPAVETPSPLNRMKLVEASKLTLRSEVGFPHPPSSSSLPCTPSQPVRRWQWPDFPSPRTCASSPGRSVRNPAPAIARPG